MLKRYQVLLPDWLGDYIKSLVDLYDLSFSEIIRTEICMAILNSTASLYPKYKSGITSKEIYRLMKEEAQKNIEREDTHRILSKIYSETRKAIEYRMAKEKKQNLIRGQKANVKC